jgi:hypothetical protein
VSGHADCGHVGTQTIAELGDLCGREPAADAPHSELITTAAFRSRRIISGEKIDVAVDERTARAGHPKVTNIATNHAHFQHLVVGAAARQSFANGADWVFFLDGDEFPASKNRAALERRLFLRTTIKLTWLNLAPTQFGSFSSFDVAQRFEYRRDLLRWAKGVPKMAISRVTAQRNPAFRMDHGSHSIRKDDGHRLISFRSGTLFHLPVRSLDRLRLKASLGAAAVGAISPGFRAYSQWNAIDEMLRASPDPQAELRNLALDYSLPRWPVGTGFLSSPIHAPGAKHPGLTRSFEEILERHRALSWRTAPEGANSIRFEGTEAVLLAK